MSTTAEYLKKLIRTVPDFPSPGILFRDITTLLKDADGLRKGVGVMLAPFAGADLDLIVGIESRGFILAAPMALQRGCGLVLIRKPGKLPAATVRQEYQLEYGSDAVEIHRDAISPGQRVLLVDDVLATGGTMAAAQQLVAGLGGQVEGISFLVELLALKGRQRLGSCRVESAIQYE
ncbi:MAG: adenine phosphoribosyltransferase [Candidatus Latescibacteria bacterium]|nr:adenine phosphoribosyltransferase [Candidatus Latescibacterota bacterium]